MEDLGHTWTVYLVYYDIELHDLGKSIHFYLATPSTFFLNPITVFINSDVIPNERNEFVLVFSDVRSSFSSVNIMLFFITFELVCNSSKQAIAIAVNLFKYQSIG